MDDYSKTQLEKIMFHMQYLICDISKSLDIYARNIKTITLDMNNVYPESQLYCTWI